MNNLIYSKQYNRLRVEKFNLRIIRVSDRCFWRKVHNGLSSDSKIGPLWCPEVSFFFPLPASYFNT